MRRRIPLATLRTASQCARIAEARVIPPSRVGLRAQHYTSNRLGATSARDIKCSHMSRSEKLVRDRKIAERRTDTERKKMRGVNSTHPWFREAAATAGRVGTYLLSAAGRAPSNSRGCSIYFEVRIQVLRTGILSGLIASLCPHNILIQE